MKTCLITGSNGLLGQTLVNLLKTDPDFQVVATGRGANRMTANDQYAYVSADLTKPNEVQAIFEQHQPEIVIHTAAMTQLEPCHEDPGTCRKVNTEAVGTLVKCCEQQQAHLIHLSTDFVFDGEEGPYREEDETKPVSVYGESKLEAEQLVKQATCTWSIVRTVLVFGLVEDMSRSNLILWVKKSLEKGEAIRVVSDQVRTPTLVDDLAEGCCLIAKKHKEGMYHISGKETYTILEMAIEAARFYGLDEQLISPVTSAELNQPAKRPPVTGFILDKAQKELGYEPHSFAESLEIMDQRFRKLTR